MFSSPMVFNKPAVILLGKKAGANRVHTYAVFAPLACERAGEIDDCGFGGVVGQGFHAAGVAAKSSDRGHIDDAATAARNHAVLTDVLGQNKITAHIQVHHLVPCLNRVVFSRCAPGGACVIHQNIHMTECLECFCSQAVNVFFIRAISGNPLHVNACGFQFGSR
jgi:hypothetical protein